MKRYSNITTQNRYDGKRVYKTTYYPPIPKSDNDLIIVASECDYLDTLAFKYYSSPTFWWIIACANPGLGRGRLSVPAGTTLRIPRNTEYIINLFNQMNK